MEETLTVLKLELPSALRGFLVTTNAIEELIGSARPTSRNVTRWRSGEMILRGTAVGLLHAEQSFSRIRGYRYLSAAAQTRTAATVAIGWNVIREPEFADALGNLPNLLDRVSARAAYCVIAGHGRIEAVNLLGIEHVPTICLEQMSETQKRAYVLADNKLGRMPV